MLPFTREQFLQVFADYNHAVWPAQIAAAAIGFAIVVLLWARPLESGRWVASGLALMWGWTGVAYHALHFSAINKAAWIFAALFVVQATSLVFFGVVRNSLRFEAARGLSGWLGWALVAYAAVIYPLLGEVSGHRYPASPMFGITPCPVTLFSYGVLLLAARPLPGWLLVIPFAWSLIGGSAAILLAVPQDGPLLASALIAPWLIVANRRLSSHRANRSH